MLYFYCWSFFFFFKQKTAYEMRISDWSSDVCSSDLPRFVAEQREVAIEEPFEQRRAFDIALAEAGGVGAHRLLQLVPIAHGGADVGEVMQIGSASCRERVCQYV